VFRRNGAGCRMTAPGSLGDSDMTNREQGVSSGRADMDEGHRMAEEGCPKTRPGDATALSSWNLGTICVPVEQRREGGMHTFLGSFFRRIETYFLYVKYACLAPQIYNFLFCFVDGLVRSPFH